MDLLVYLKVFCVTAIVFHSSLTYAIWKDLRNKRIRKDHLASQGKDDEKEI